DAADRHHVADVAVRHQCSPYGALLDAPQLLNRVLVVLTENPCHILLYPAASRDGPAPGSTAGANARSCNFISPPSLVYPRPVRAMPYTSTSTPPPISISTASARSCVGCFSTKSGSP